MSRALVAVLATVMLAGCSGGAPDPKVLALINELGSPSVEARTRAAQEIQRFGPAASAAVPALIANLGTGHRNQMLVVNATNALLRIGPRASVPKLIEAVQAGDPEIAYGAAFTLGGFGAAAKPAVPALLAALENPDVRPAAHTALQMIGEES